MQVPSKGIVGCVRFDRGKGLEVEDIKLVGRGHSDT